jgi:anti-sigma factor (TIGR02949 family)
VSPLPDIVEISCEEVRRELVNYAEGYLTPELRARIEHHLKTCRHCLAVYDGAQNVVRLLGDKAVFHLPEGFSQRLRQKFASQIQAADHPLADHPLKD